MEVKRREVVEKALAHMTCFDPRTMEIEKWVKDFDGICEAIRLKLE